LRLWDAATAAPLATLEGHTDRVKGALALADGRILSWSSDHTLRLWDGTTGAQLATLEGHTKSVHRALALADGRILSWSWDSTLRFWDGATGAPLATLDGHTSAVRSARALADGRILSRSSDHTLRLWDAATGAPLAAYAKPRDWVDAPEEVVAAQSGDRALHHALHLGFGVACENDDFTVFTGGRHLRICRFVAGVSS
jgi:WD40 repeat protein